MQGAFLRFYVHEGERHHGKLLWEWLLEQAKGMGLRGGSALRAMAGFGRHHTLHANHFFELAGDLPVEVEFIVSDEEASALLALIAREGVRVFYARIPVSFDVINSEGADGAGGRG
ncbi:MAG: DUF190 domain-containing protein [Gammaproteobacteria bacterium]|nr:DUF190 domain-containing protein [Gammaproteobacteria bacterium]MCG3146024.1 hypothetical protein [Gammaproteobacteria bacterium]